MRFVYYLSTTREMGYKNWVVKTFNNRYNKRNRQYLTKVSKNSPSSTGGRGIAEKRKRTLVLRCEVWYTIISRKDRKD